MVRERQTLCVKEMDSVLQSISIGGLGKNKAKKDDAAQPTASAANVSKDSAKELQKLRRLDLLELLLEQTRETERLSARVEDLEGLSDRLKAKLDDKDAQIEHLKQRLDAKDARIAKLDARNRTLLEASGSIDMDELREVEERAIEEYLAHRMGRKTAHGAPAPIAQPQVARPDTTAAIQKKAKHGN